MQTHFQSNFHALLTTRKVLNQFRDCDITARKLSILLELKTKRNKWDILFDETALLELKEHSFQDEKEQFDSKL